MSNESFGLIPTQKLEKSTNRFEEITPELLTLNFESWEARLCDQLAQKYPNKLDRDGALNKAEEFAKNLALYNCMKLEGVHSFTQGDKSLHSNKMLREKNAYFSSVTGTNENDVKFGRDNFVFLKFGDAVFAGQDRVALGIDPTILSRKEAFVTLEDLAMVRHRVPKEESGKYSWENAWQQQKKEIWRGVDFKVLFPYFLAISFDDPKDYYSRKLSTVFYDSTGESKADLHDRIASFEVMVLNQIPETDILFVAEAGESGFYRPIQEIEKDLENIGKPIFEVPANYRREQKSELLNSKYREFFSA